MKKLKGFSVLEIVLAAGLFAIFALGIALAVFQGMKNQQKAGESQAARILAREGIEAVRALRSQSFDALTDTNGSGIRFSGGRWELFGEEDSLDGFTRVIAIGSARRDGDNIVVDGGDEDADLKRVTSKVTWGNQETEFSSYMSRREITVPMP